MTERTPEEIEGDLSREVPQALEESTPVEIAAPVSQASAITVESSLGLIVVDASVFEVPGAKNP